MPATTLLKPKATVTISGHDAPRGATTRARARQIGARARRTEARRERGPGPNGDNSDENLQALCHQHHSLKTVRENRGFGRTRTTLG
jgi:hypothetical protein